MIAKIFAVFLLLSFVGFTSIGQNIQNDSASVVNRIRTDVYTISDDSMLGRETASEGEQKAARYLVSKFSELGIPPAFDKGKSYLQPFDYNRAPTLKDDNYCIVNKNKCVLKTDWYPVSYSGNGVVSGEVVKLKYGIHAPEFQYDDYAKNPIIKGKIVAIDMSAPVSLKSNESFLEAYSNVNNRIDYAVKQGAIAVILYNNDKDINAPSMRLLNLLKTSEVPVIYIQQKLKKTLMDASKCNISIAVNIDRGDLKANNIGAFIDNNAMNTIVIGAHYDHLGTDEIEGIYNGADDNASGVAAVLELARQLKNSEIKSNNFLFIFFSGEEKGFLGSTHFLKSKEYDVAKINFMLNFDMVGRLSDNPKKITIYGCGTSEIWNQIFSEIKSPLEVNCFESGLGSSDHTPFYLKGIPALHFFTELHKDYHKITDDADKLNYPGIRTIVLFAMDALEKIHEKNQKPGQRYADKIAFKKTNDSNTSRKNLKVTLGVVPDHTYNGKGLRISAVKDGQAASQAGLKEGDIILKLGSIEVLEINSYMKALGSLQKDTQIESIILRDSTQIKIPIKL